MTITSFRKHPLNESQSPIVICLTINVLGIISSTGVLALYINPMNWY